MCRENTGLPLSRETDEGSDQGEKILLEAIRQKKENAWSLLIERYQGRLLNFAISKLRQRADAEDVIQDTFISFIKGLENYRGEVSLETYLFTILRNKIIDQYRSSNTKTVSLLQDVFCSSENGENQDVLTRFFRRWHFRKLDCKSKRAVSAPSEYSRTGAADIV